MSHPITGARRSVLIYSLIWLLIAAIQGLLFYYVLDFPAVVVISDTLLSTVSFALLGLLAWYPARYIPFHRSAPFNSLLAHLAAGILVLAIWAVISIGLLSAIFAHQAEYQEFLDRTLVQRVVLGTVFYLVLVLVYYLVSSSQKLSERAEQEKQLRELVRDAELNMLKAQINPHFLFNSLNSISSLTMSNPEEARDMIIRLSDFLRYSLKHRENEYVPLKEELGRMTDYLAIEKVRFGEKLLFDFNISDNCEQFPVPTMIFQPLFENAIRHSVYESTSPVQIRFTCTPEGEYMRVQISNDYDPGVPARRGTGVGLQNVRQRIKLAYKERGSVSWKGENGVFEVSILFPNS